MAKIIVVVNNKYITKIEASSECVAEHSILDGIYGVNSAQSFAGEELKSGTFMYHLQECEFISLAELKKKGDRLIEATKLKEQYQNLVEANDAKIAKMEEEINNLKQSTLNMGSQIGEYLRIESEGL